MPSSLVGVKGISISQNRPTHTLSLDAEYQCKRKSPPQDGFGNTFGNKGVVSLQTLIKPLTLAEEVRFELTEDFHPRQFSRLVHSTALPLFLCVLRARL